MLTVSWNIAAGKGFVYNYDIKTTGVQPLAALLYAVPAFLVQSFNGNKYLFVRVVILFASIMQVLFAFLIYKAALSISKVPDKGMYFMLAVLIVLFNFKVMLNFENGLETGLYLILLSVFFLYWIKFEYMQSGIKHILGLGLLSGLLVLCRLDALIILCIFYCGLLITKRIRLLPLVQVLIAAFIIYLPWQLYVWSVTGNLLQSSARSQTSIFTLYNLSYKTEQYFVAIIQQVTPFLYTGNIRLWMMVLLGVPYIIFIVIGYKKFRSNAIQESSEKILILLAIPFVVLLIMYFFFSTAPYFYFRYTSFVMVLSFPVLVVLFAEILKKYDKVIKSGLLIILFGVFIIQAFLYLHSGKSALAFAVRSEFAKNNFNNEIRIASFQTGVLGFYNENVFNLDGKMDNKALINLRNNTMDRYLDSLNIGVLLGWNDIIQNVFTKQYIAKNWQIYSSDIGDGRTVCYVRK